MLNLEHLPIYKSISILMDFLFDILIFYLNLVNL